MADIAALVEQYGWQIVIIVLIILNAGKIAGALESFYSKISPAFAEKRKFEQERAAREWEKSERDRVDAVLIAKEMLANYRAELETARREYAQINARVYDVLQEYERNMGKFANVLSDFGDLVRTLCDKTDLIYECVKNNHREIERTLSDGRQANGSPP